LRLSDLNDSLINSFLLVNLLTFWSLSQFSAPSVPKNPSVPKHVNQANSGYWKPLRPLTRKEFQLPIRDAQERNKATNSDAFARRLAESRLALAEYIAKIDKTPLTIASGQGVGKPSLLIVISAITELKNEGNNRNSHFRFDSITILLFMCYIIILGFNK
jgi:hypothetical protein